MTNLLQAAWDRMNERDGDRASIRNGIGFNGGDSMRAARLSRYPFARWNNEMVDGLVSTLRKYSAQLATVGIDYSQIAKEHAAGSYYRTAQPEGSATRTARPRFSPASAPGRCSVCGRNFAAKELIGFAKRNDGRYDRFHQACDATAVPALAPAAKVAPVAPVVAPDADPGITDEARDAIMAHTFPDTAHAISTIDTANEVLARVGNVRMEREIAETFKLAAERYLAAQKGATDVAPDAVPDGSDAAAVGTFLGVPADVVARATAPKVDATIGQKVDGPTATSILGPGGTIAQNLPNYESRPEQMRLATTIEQAIAERKHVVGEAGTGTGKSLAYLVPAILHAVRTGTQVIVSTAVIALQDQLINSDLPFLARVMGVPFTYELLKGRSNYVCLHGVVQTKVEVEANGLERSEDWAHWQLLLQKLEDGDWDGDLADFAEPLSASLRELVTTDSDGCLGQNCPLFSNCKVEIKKARAKKATIIVVNHALVMIDAYLYAKSDGQVSVLPDVPVLVLDEAHQLEEIATSHLGDELTAGGFVRHGRKLDKLTRKHPNADEDGTGWVLRFNDAETKLRDALDVIDKRLTDAKTQQQVLGDERALFAPFVDAATALVNPMRAACPHWLEGDERETWGKLADQLEAFVGAVGGIADPADPDLWVRFAEIENGGEAGSNRRQQRRRLIKIVRKPIEVADDLRRMLFERYKTIVSVSATLATGTTFDHWRARVGCDRCDAAEIIVGSPFDYAAHSILYVPSLADMPASTKDNTPVFYDALAKNVLRLVRAAAEVNTFVLFTSNRALGEVRNRIEEELSATHQVLVQGEQSRKHIVAEFKNASRLLPCLLFGTRTYFEGVDLQGDALELVVLDKLPFPNPSDPVYDARCRVLQRRYKDQWAHWDRLTIPMVITTVKQVFGRLIRTGEDRGTVAILDPRLNTKPYGRKIFAAMPPARRTSLISDVHAMHRS